MDPAIAPAFAFSYSVSLKPPPTSAPKEVHGEEVDRTRKRLGHLLADDERADDVENPAHQAHDDARDEGVAEAAAEVHDLVASPDAEGEE